jgi:hypothetical protein
MDHAFQSMQLILTPYFPGETWRSPVPYGAGKKEEADMYMQKGVNGCVKGKKIAKNLIAAALQAVILLLSPLRKPGIQTAGSEAPSRKRSISKRVFARSLLRFAHKMV